MVSNDEILLKERIRFVLTHYKETVADWDSNETKQVRYRRQVNQDAAVPYSTMLYVLNRYPAIDANWLIAGEGSMFKADHVAPKIYNTKNEVNGSKAGGSINVGTATIPYPVQALLDEKDKRIAELEKDKAQLQGLLSVFTRQAESVGPKKK